MDAVGLDEQRLKAEKCYLLLVAYPDRIFSSSYAVAEFSSLQYTLIG